MTATASNRSQKCWRRRPHLIRVKSVEEGDHI